MKKLFAVILAASIGAVLFAAETAPTTGGEPRANPENRQRPFFTDKNQDGICDNYRDFPCPLNHGRHSRGFHDIRRENYRERLSRNNRNYCNPGTGRNHHGFAPEPGFAPAPGKNRPTRNTRPDCCHGHGRKHSFSCNYRIPF